MVAYATNRQKEGCRPVGRILGFGIYSVAALKQGADPGRILLLTFTRRAVEIMCRRAASIVGTAARLTWAGTFHSIANRLLRLHASAVGLDPAFTVLDRSDSARHVLDYDEYQDTNALQAEIVLAMARDHRSVSVVGDDAQSIYAFRGATVRNILEFPAHSDPRCYERHDRQRAFARNVVRSRSHSSWPRRMSRRRRTI